MRFLDSVAIVTGAGYGAVFYRKTGPAEGARVVIAEIDEAAGRETALDVGRLANRDCNQGIHKGDVWN